MSLYVVYYKTANDALHYFQHSWCKVYRLIVFATVPVVEIVYWGNHGGHSYLRQDPWS